MPDLKHIYLIKINNVMKQYYKSANSLYLKHKYLDEADRLCKLLKGLEMNEDHN